MAASIACIAFNNGKVLIAHRNPVGQMGGRWEFPGGKVEDGESLQQAAIREFQEEFGVAITVGEQIAQSAFVHNGKTVPLTAYRIYVPHDGIAVPYTLSEHTEYRWVTLDEIASLDFVDSDLKIYPDVKNYFSEYGK